jgi:hypothetical protein
MRSSGGLDERADHRRVNRSRGSVDAYVSDADSVPVWNELYLEVWPEPGPARITLVAGFVSPVIHFELMATAVR